MKKIVLTLIVLTLFAGLLFANGTPEEQKFFENLMRNSQPVYPSSTSTRGSSSTGSEIISRDMATLERLYQYVDQNFLYDIDYEAVYEAMATEFAPPAAGSTVTNTVSVTGAGRATPVTASFSAAVMRLPT